MKIAVLLSGGVDSSVALKLLKDAGHDLTAFYLKIWLQDEYSFLGECPWEEDLKYARGVCEQAEVPLEVISLQTEYWDSVVSYTISEIVYETTESQYSVCKEITSNGTSACSQTPLAYFKSSSQGHSPRKEYSSCSQIF